MRDYVGAMQQVEDEARRKEREDNKIPEGPLWLTSWQFWLQAAVVGCGLAAIRYYSNGGSWV